jgi:hypothetical protein
MKDELEEFKETYDVIYIHSEARGTFSSHVCISVDNAQEKFQMQLTFTATMT